MENTTLTALAPLFNLFKTITAVIIVMILAQLIGQGILKAKGKDSRHARQGLSLLIVLLGAFTLLLVMR